MSGTREGGLKAAAKNKANDPDFYARIGAKGGKLGNTGGFAAYQPCSCAIFPFSHYKQQCAGKKGGLKSRRTKVEKES